MQDMIAGAAWGGFSTGNAFAAGGDFPGKIILEVSPAYLKQHHLAAGKCVLMRAACGILVFLHRNFVSFLHSSSRLDEVLAHLSVCAAVPRLLPWIVRLAFGLLPDSLLYPSIN